MNAEIKAKWVDALRSGKYQQGKDALRVDDSFCCLGVLCDIIDPTKWGPYNGYATVQNSSTYEGKVYYLPDSVGEQSELNDTICDTVIEMNDKGKSFAEIADYIEANY